MDTEKPQYEIDGQPNSVEVRIRVFQNRVICFKAITPTGTLKDRQLVKRYITGSILDGKITPAMEKRARRKARIAINKKRRESGFSCRTH